MFIFVACGNGGLEGTWQKFNTTSKGEEVVITKNEITVDDIVHSYKISEDKKHLVLGQGLKSVSYELLKSKLTIDGETYYRKDSEEYKEQEKKMNDNLKKQKAEEKKLEESEKEWKNKVSETKSNYEKALSEAEKRMSDELLKKLEGNWVSEKDNSKDKSTDYKKINYSFDNKGKVDYSYYSKNGYGDSINETTDKGSGMLKFKYSGDLYIDTEAYGSGLDSSIEKTKESEKKLTQIEDKTKELDKLTLDNYLEELKKKREGNTYTSDYLEVSITENIGNFDENKLVLNFPEADSSVLQIRTGWGDFIDFRKI